MSIFRKGEKIICINIKGAQHVTLNKTYTVIESFTLQENPNYDYVDIVCNNGKISRYVDYRFKSVSKDRKEKLEKLNNI